MRKPLLPVIAAGVFAMVGTACAAQADKAPPGGDYQKVSELVALPEFLPGMGALYVQPATLPAGPFLAYDRSERLVSTIYMIPLEDIEAHKGFSDLAVGGERVTSTDLYYNAGHPGVEKPHYHVVLWHVTKSDAELE
ncbi:hypothetical protein [Marinimicrococcus flavescens]|uniref:Lipoprotein n=1 Tax=Marinimicrococcus flavescens TaxID=3031815 RepID=A0AAP3UYQ1_9PROT|nr:hypothetical protein [Marinimicrococcus flavescens]